MSDTKQDAVAVLLGDAIRILRKLRDAEVNSRNGSLHYTPPEWARDANRVIAAAALATATAPDEVQRLREEPSDARIAMRAESEAARDV